MEREITFTTPCDRSDIHCMLLKFEHSYEALLQSRCQSFSLANRLLGQQALSRALIMTFEPLQVDPEEDELCHLQSCTTNAR